MTSKLAKITLTLALFAFLTLSSGCDKRGSGYGSYTDSIFSFDVFDSIGSYWGGGGGYYDDYYSDEYYEEEYYTEEYDDYSYGGDGYYYDDWWKKKQ